MHVPDRYVWVALGLAVLHALGLVPIVRRLRGPEPALRFRARLELLETAAMLFLVGGLFLSVTFRGHLVLARRHRLRGPDRGCAARGVRGLRARRSTTSRPARQKPSACAPAAVAGVSLQEESPA
ncbi:hypothetical protein ACFVJ8_28810 [Streptomyces yangpuensis]|uniref:hypothetical protein n=1 Tax=Streptomyces yangpuensis TaxID=1648182 RepID=UPI00362993FB